MAYINISTLEYPLTLRQVERAISPVVIPKQPSEDTLNEHDFATVQPVERPTGDVVTEGQSEQQPDGTWRQTWDVRSYTVEEATAALERAKESAMERVNDGYKSEMGAILDAYPQAETLTWDKQEREARTWQADNAAPTPYIDALAAARSMSKAELVTRILAKADAWVSLSGAATGKRQALEDAISNALTMDAVEIINW